LESLNQGVAENEDMARLILVPWLLLAWLAPIPGLAAPQQHAKPAAKSAPKQTKPGFETYHAGPWEQRIGYSQAVRSGRMLYISGTVGANGEGNPTTWTAK